MAYKNSWGGATSPGQASYFDGYDNLPPASSDYFQHPTQGNSPSAQTPSNGNLYSQPYGPPSPSPSGQSAQSGRSRISTWFRSRSRSGSPGDTQGNNRRRSRSRSKTPTEGFVVRSVVKQAGGVSACDIAVLGSESAAEDESRTTYQRSKSRPLSGGGGGGAMAMSLGVPPGGPGGGTGYGTAYSSNDGRPEVSSSEMRTPMFTPSSSPQGFVQPQSALAPASPVRPASPGVAKASVFHKPRRLSASPASPVGKHSSGKSGLNLPTSPIGERWNPNQGDLIQGMRQGLPPIEHSQAYWNESTINPSTSAHDIPGFDPSAFDHDSEASHISFTVTPNTGQQAPVHSIVARAWNTDGNSSGSSNHVQSKDGLASPSSPLRLITNALHSSTANPSSPSNAISPAAGPGLASKLRGFFNSRPYLDGVDDEAGVGAVSDDEGTGGGKGTPYGVSSRVLTSPRRGSAQPPELASPQISRRMDAADWEAEELRRQTQLEAVRLIDEDRRRAMEPSAASDHPKSQLETCNQTAVLSPSPQRGDVPSLPSSLARELQEEGWTSDTLSQLTESGRRDLVRRLTAKGIARSAQSSAHAAEQSENAGSGDGQQQMDGETEIRWEYLTPAQRIIAETRARYLEDARSSVVQTTEGPLGTRHVGDEVFEIPVRRSTRSRSPRKKAVPLQESPFRLDAQPQSTPSAAEARATVEVSKSQQVRPELPGSVPTTIVTTITSDKVGISPGNGPLPSQMKLMDGLEEMMVRFYRFERYAVPLLRALEGRVGDVEKDAMMALQSSAARPSNTEMDRWVAEMTRLMKHEISQLKAAGKELREGRHILGAILVVEKAKGNEVGSRKPHDASVPEGRAYSPARANTAQPQDGPRSLSPSKLQSGRDFDQERGRLKRPAGTGRPKYTSALGKPMVDGRVSASASPERCGDSSAMRPVTPTQELIVLQRAKSTAATVGVSPELEFSRLAPPLADASFSIDADDDEEGDEDEEEEQSEGVNGEQDARHDVMPSADTSGSFSIGFAEDEESGEADTTCEDGLRTPSQNLLKRGASTTSSGDAFSSGREEVDVNSRRQIVMRGLQNTADSASRAQAAAVNTTSDSHDAQRLRSKAPSITSTHTVTNHRASELPERSPTVAASSRGDTSLAPPSASTVLPLLGGRTSPSPGGIIASRNLESRRKTSPAATIVSSAYSSQNTPLGSPKLIPDVKREEIRIRGPMPINSGGALSSRPGAGSGLQARAQSYLQSVASTDSPTSSARLRHDSSSSSSASPSSPRKGGNSPAFSPTFISGGVSGPKSTFSTSILPGPGPVGNNQAVRSRGGGPTMGMTLKERVALFEVSANRM